MVAVREGSVISLDRQVAGLLDRAMSPRQFWEWFIGAETEIEDRDDAEELELSALIENRFAEWTSGYVTAERLLSTIAEDRSREVSPLIVGEHNRDMVGRSTGRSLVAWMPSERQTRFDSVPVRSSSLVKPRFLGFPRTRHLRPAARS